jgi:predicted alpha/beta hydrolase
MSFRESFDVRAPDGSRSSLFVGRAGAERAPVVLCIPAIGIRAAYYAPFADALARLGVHFAVIELRGIGASSVRASRAADFGYATLVEQDLPAAIEQARAAFPSSPIWLLGHSLGGHLACALVARRPGLDVEGPVLVASGLSWYRHFPLPRGPMVLAYTQAATAAAHLLGHFPGARLGFGGREARTLMRDLGRIARTGRFEPRGLEGLEKALALVERRVWAISLAGDGLAPEAAVEALLAKLPGCEVTHWRYVASEHGMPAVDHNRWPRHGEAIAAQIVSWMGESRRPIEASDAERAECGA